MKKCQFCAEDIQGSAIVCKHCGRDLPGVGDTETTVLPTVWSEKLHARVKAILLGLGFIWVAAIVIFIAAAINTPSDVRQETPHTHALLLAESLTARATRLGRIVRATGSTCETPYKPFFQGQESETGTVLWQVACAKGDDYVVSIKTDESVTAAACAHVQALTGVPCFQTFKR